MRDMCARLDRKSRFRSSLEKPNPPICQIDVSSFYKENLYSEYFLKMILGIFMQDEGNRYMISLFGNKKDQNSWNRFTLSKMEHPDCKTGISNFSV
jgi:hypothetical protein